MCARCLQVLELLLAMCTVSGLRPLLCEVVFRPVGPKLRAAGRRQGAGLEACRKAESGLALVQWLSSPVEGAESCSLQVLQLLNELLEVRQTADRQSRVCVCQPCRTPGQEKAARVAACFHLVLPVLLRASLSVCSGGVGSRKCV